MNGIALTVLLSQIPKLFGFSVNAKGPLRLASISTALSNVFEDQNSNPTCMMCSGLGPVCSAIFKSSGVGDLGRCAL
jgi:MFS superfamily sulfate permease-like transporter